MPQTARTCRELAEAQLAAYNARDLDAFCACYHPEVRVLDADGGVTIQGLALFRERYGALFGECQELGAAVDARLVAEPHVVDDERWWRTRRSDGQKSTGRVLVRYTVRDGKIAVVQFFRGAP